MAGLARRKLAIYATDSLSSGRSPKQIAKELAAALAIQNKQSEVDLLLGDIAYELENRGLVAIASVTAVNSLSNGLRKELSSQIKGLSHVRDVIINEQIDKSVIGGLRINTAKHSWDKTIMRKLADIKGEI